MNTRGLILVVRFHKFQKLVNVFQLVGQDLARKKLIFVNNSSQDSTDAKLN
jgi:hypothetical protein